MTNHKFSFDTTIIHNKKEYFVHVDCEITPDCEQCEIKHIETITEVSPSKTIAITSLNQHSLNILETEAIDEFLSSRSENEQDLENDPTNLV